MSPTLRALLLAALALSAGCVRAPEAEAPAALAEEDAQPPTPAAPQTGMLTVLAVFADRTPLAGVNVSVGNESRLTDATGTARFDALVVGTHTLVASKTAHRTAQQLVTIHAGGETTAEVVLAAEDGGQHAHKVGFEAHTDVYAFEGHFDCSATYVIITGDCLIVVENVTRTLGAPDPVSNATSERNIIDFPLDINWSALVVEMAWNDPSPPTSDGMTLALEPAEAPADGHAAKYARVHGPSPLRIELAPGVKHASATLDDMPKPEGGEVIRSRAFMRGHAHNPGGTTFLGAGVATEVRFTLYVSVFYGEGAPSGYTAIPAR
ncbi:MAG TPA: carboxypeptidase-like regulatory domain-containing protein [Candidatus Thermoplasmatota archaeon]|nr:carboxypeptidase-like regulatory domain-containing protein [Candidatus Thermoplasmatota archaeon]